MIIRIVLALSLMALAIAQYQPQGNSNGRSNNQYGSMNQQYQQPQMNNNNNNNNNNYNNNNYNGRADQQQQQQQQHQQVQQQQLNYNSNQRSVLNQVLTPYNQTSKLDNSNSGVTIQFQLRSYNDPNSALPNGATCVCPSGFKCSYLNVDPFCNFGFSFIVSSPDASVRYISTGFFTLVNGQLPPANGILNGNRWDENYVLQLPSKPSAIDVMVHHLGAVINQADGTPIHIDTVTHVDAFVVPLNNVLPAVNGGVQSMNQQSNYDGKLLGTKLGLSFSIACTGSLIGPNCDMSCQTSHINSNVAACRSNTTSFYSVCTYSGNGQVDNCKPCPWGIRENTYCQTEDGNVLDPKHAGVVDTSFKTATIILGVICGILLILFILALLLACILRRRQPEDKEMYTASSQPLIKAGYPIGNDMPTAQPRSQPPSLDTRPMKSALRRPMVPTQQQQNSTLNDTRDTSFSNEVPMRPSRSQVV
ncbi:unnamed protein product [Auanema sp. JU1783]|nr:unnamed protein product [Auanema sp. JU1783]